MKLKADVKNLLIQVLLAGQGDQRDWGVFRPIAGQDLDRIR